MRLSKSNVLSGITSASTISVTTGGASTDDPLNMVDPDFSKFYQSSQSDRLVVEFGPTAVIDYVAVAGVNIEGRKDFTSYVSVSDGSTEVVRIYVNNNQPVFLNFEARSFTNLKVELYSPIGDNPLLTYVAAGEALTVPNGGEQSGYQRNHIPRHYRQRVTVNGQAEPIGVLRHKVQAKGKLSIPNALITFAESEWQDFLDFAEADLFFVQERDPEAISGGTTLKCQGCYVGYDPMSRAMAHSQTRTLVRLQLDFKVSNGL